MIELFQILPLQNKSNPPITNQNFFLDILRNTVAMDILVISYIVIASFIFISAFYMCEVFYLRIGYISIAEHYGIIENILNAIHEFPSEIAELT